ncbi:MAG: YihY/virulence factor BrkB family protein [Erysipelotrichaceae bacterium]|nr:YihY/virulence factor BrkB family protein [Erysipelotrichaceae bacterium]
MDKIKDVILEFLSPEANLFVYSLSFGLLLSLAPSLIIFAMMFKWGNFLDIEVVIDLFRSLHLSNDIQVLIEEIFMEFMNKEYGFVPAITTLCLSFWLASRSINSFLLISASHEKVEVPKFAIRIQSIVMFLVFVAMLIGGVLVATLIYRFVNASLLPMLAAVIMVPVFTMMYRSLSFRKRSLSYGLIGGLFATSAVILLFYLSFILIQRMIMYNRIYGSLASLVALLLVIYIFGSIVYLGFLLNLVCEESYGKEERLRLKHARYYALCERLYERLPFVKRDGQ